MNSVTEKVKKFYTSLPFNSYSSIEQQLYDIQTHNQISYYKSLNSLLHKNNKITIAEIGCGSGWFLNSAACHYQVSGLGIDINYKAIQQAQEVSEKLKASNVFLAADFLRLDIKDKFDLIVSIGALHHMQDPIYAIEKALRLVSENASSRIFLGLYHTYGRKPFLDLFGQLKASLSDDFKVFKCFSEMVGNKSDFQLLMSWYQDQVNHPFEVQYTLAEVNEILESQGFELETTSINNDAKIASLSELFSIEKKYEAISYKRNVIEKKFFPGLFTVLARRKSKI